MLGGTARRDRYSEERKLEEAEQRKRASPWSPVCGLQRKSLGLGRNSLGLGRVGDGSGHVAPLGDVLDSGAEVHCGAGPWWRPALWTVAEQAVAGR